jgi:DNA-binding NarL/FixJ family response regulator
VTRVIITGADGRTRLRVADALTSRTYLDLCPVASVHELLDRREPPHLLVWCCDTFGTGEVALLKEIRTGLPDLRVVVVSESIDMRGARRAVDAGIDGFVNTYRLTSALGPTVDAVLAGQTAVPLDLRACLRKPALSTREKQILGMVVLGFTNSQIGARLFLAESTVKSHLSSAYTKLSVRSRSEAVAMILDPHGSLGAGVLALTPDAAAPGRRGVAAS